MRYLKNYLLILIIRISNMFGRGLTLKNKTFSSRLILEKNFLENQAFNFVQVGANDGISFDFLYDFVLKRASEGIVIEPIREYFRELENNYGDFSSIIKVNKAVHPFEKFIFIHKISPKAISKYPDWVKGIASFDPEHHLKTGINTDDIVKEEVQADSLMNILHEYLKNDQIDYFQVDTEGFDFEVLKGLDFKCFVPTIIKYESVNLSIIDQKKLKILLKKQNYFLFEELGDTVAVNMRKTRLF